MCPSNPLDLQTRPQAGLEGSEFTRRNGAMAGELARLAAAEIERGDFAAAETLLRQGLAQDQEHPACRGYLAMCLAAQAGGLERAEEMARSVTKEHPREPVGWFALGQAELNAGKRRAAFQHFAQARRLAGRDKELRERIARRDPRRTPVFAGLPREHVLNRICGRIRSLRGRS